MFRQGAIAASSPPLVPPLVLCMSFFARVLRYGLKALKEKYAKSTINANFDYFSRFRGKHFCYIEKIQFCM